MVNGAQAESAGDHMGMDPFTIAEIGIMAVSAYGATKSKKPRDPAPVHTTVTKTAGEQKGGARQVKKYRPAAQTFGDDDLRLGMAGRLGL